MPCLCLLIRVSMLIIYIVIIIHLFKEVVHIKKH